MIPNSLDLIPDPDRELESAPNGGVFALMNYLDPSMS